MTFLEAANQGFIRVNKEGVAYDTVPAFFPYVDYLFCGYRSPLAFKVIRQASKEDVQSSYETVCRAAGMPYERLAMTHIVHGDRVLRVTEEMAGMGVSRAMQLPECDGIYTDVPHLPIASTHADCMPVAYFSPDRHTGCVVHAGWRGVLSGIHRKAFAQLLAHGCKGEDMLIAIGPCIHQCCFEVGSEVSQAFLQAYSAGSWLTSRGGREYIDLLALVLLDFEQLGVHPSKVTVDTRCTCCPQNNLQSYRRDGKTAGTMVQIMCLRP